MLTRTQPLMLMIRTYKRAHKTPTVEPTQCVCVRAARALIFFPTVMHLGSPKHAPSTMTLYPLNFATRPLQLHTTPLLTRLLLSLPPHPTIRTTLCSLCGAKAHTIWPLHRHYHQQQQQQRHPQSYDQSLLEVHHHHHCHHRLLQRNRQMLGEPRRGRIGPSKLCVLK